MNCDACGASNDADARFCEDCGAPQSRRCPSCDTAVRANARFCKGCGAALDDDRVGPGDTRHATRKTVTVLFADLGGSTGFEEQVDPETARAVLGRYHETLGSIAEELGAGTVKFAGDGVMAVWGVPEIAADDADRAVRAGIAMQVAFERIEADVAQRFDAAITLRVAINTGEVVVGDDDADIVGDALNVAARLEKDCPAGQVVVGDETWRATRGDHDFESLGEVEVTGRDGAVGVHLLRGAAAPEASMPFVGRDAEAARIRALFDTAVEERALRLVSIVGEPGVGKTTLARSCTEDLGVPIVGFACTADSAVALGPIVDVLRTIVDDDGAPAIGSLVPDDVADRDRVVGVVTDLVTGGAAHTVEETFRSLRRLVEVTATDNPLVIVIDDIQWADPLLLDFIEHLVEWVRDSPVLVVALARPEIRDVRPTLGEASRWVDVAIPLEGLDSEATRRLAAELLGADDVPVELADRLPESTRGNPLFVRELMRMLVHDGVLEQDDDVWRLTVDVDAIDVPPTVKSLLSTRIERLPDNERRMIEVGGVIGTDFDLGAVAALLGTSASAVLTLAERLRRLQLVEPAGTYAGDDPVWRFHHVLIREVAYGRLLKADRAELHERLADHRAELGGADVDEVVARHLDAAHGYRRELGDTGDHVAALGVRAATRYLAAAQRALDRDELTSAASLAANGVSVAGDDRSLAAELAMLGCEASLTALDAATGAALVDRFAESIDDPDDPWLVCFASQLAMLTDPDALPTADADLTRVIDDFSAAGDRQGLAKAHLVRARVRARLGRVADCEADLDQALVAAREADDRRRVTAVLGAAPTAALWGPSPVPRAGGRCLDVIRLQRITTAAPSVEATSVRCQAVLEALRGRVDNARSMIASAHQTVRDLGLRHGQAETELFEGIIETIAGDPAAAEPHFRAALDGLGSLGVGVDAGQAAALLAKSLLAQDQLDEADRYASESEKLAGQNLKTAIAWRTARAEILAAQGRTDDAVALAREAVDIGAGTDIVLDHADACLTLSRVLAAAGDTSGATQARSEADRLHEAKGAEAMLSAATMSTAGPSSSPPTEDPVGRVESRLALDNAAARAVANVIPRAHRHDFASAFADSFVRLDHRSVMNTPNQDRDAVVESFRHLLDVTGDVALVPVAVRGDRLVLHDITFAQPDGFGLHFLGLAEIDEDGRITAMVSFDHDDLARATTELDERFHAGEGAPHAPNGRLLTEWNDAALHRDWDRFRDCLHHEFVNAFHAQVWPPLDGDELARVYGDVMAEGHTDIWYSAIEWPATDVAITKSHHRIDRDGQDLLWDWLLVWQFRDGKIWRLDTFDADQSAEAFALVDELTRSTDDRPRVDNRAMRAVEAAIERLRHGDPDLESSYVKSFARVDHREVLSAPEQDREAFVDNLRELYDMTGTVTITPIAVRGERVALFGVVWTEDDGFEIRLIAVGEIDEAGGITAVATFDADDLRGAHAELDARYDAGEGARLRVDNHAARAAERAIARLRDDDPDLATSFAESFTRIDHRPVTNTPEQDRDAFLASVRELYEVTGEISLRRVAVRGERLALHDATFAERDGFGVRMLSLVETDSDGRIAHMATFEADDLRAAHAELDARYWAGEGAEHAEHGRLFTEWIEASLDGDWDRFRAIFHEEFVNQIHGQVFPTLDVDGLVELNADVMREGAADLWYSSVEWPAPDVALSLSHRRIDRDGQVLQWDYLMVHQFRDRKIWRLDSFDVDQADEAFALVAELTRSSPDPLPVENRATRNADRIAAAYEAGDLDRLMAVFSDDIVSEDRRRVVASEPRRGREVREAHRETLSVISHYDYEPLAVRCDTLALTRLWLSDDSGAAIEMLSVGEVDDDGRVSSYVIFDPDDFLEAMLELDRRYFAGEGRDHAHNAPGFTDFYAGTMRGDLDAVRRAMTDDFQLVWPGGLWPDMDADGMVEGTAEILADDTERRMWVSAVEWVAPDIEWSRAHRHEIDADGVETQWEWYIVSQYRDGLAHRAHCFEPENVDAARAFVESLVATAEQPTSDPFVMENRSTRVMTRVQAAWNAGDADRLLDCYELDVERDDRRSVVSSGIARGAEVREGLVALLDVMPRVTPELLAIRGDRLALERTSLSAESTSEIEMLIVIEVSDDDRITSYTSFDPDDFDAAMLELDRRYYAGEGAPFDENGKGLTQYVSTIRHRRFDGLAALVHDDWDFHGHEGTLWTAVGMDEYGDMVRETFAEATWSQVWQPTVFWLSPEVAVAPFHHRSRYADGSEAEWRFVNVGVWDGGRMHELHTFDGDDAEAALEFAHERARALDGGPLSFPNQALVWMKNRKRMHDDPDGGVGRFAPDFRRIDRRTVLHDADADREHYLRSSAEMEQLAPTLGAAPIAGRGDLLSCVLLVGGREGAQVPLLIIDEFDADGSGLEAVTFDGDDIADAMLELDRRYYAGEGAAFAANGGVLTAVADANCRRDLDRYRSLLADDFVARTHSGLSWPDQDAEEQVRLNREVMDGADEYAMWLRAVHWHSDSVVSFIARRRTVTDGIEREWDLVTVAHIEGGKVRSLDFWRDLADIDRAIDAATAMAEAAHPLALANASTRLIHVDGVPPGDRLEADLERIDHRSTVFGERRIDRDGLLRGVEELDLLAPHRSWTTLAVRGDRSSLIESVHGTGDGRELRILIVGVISEFGRWKSFDLFDVDELPAALQCLDERYYADEGREFAAGGAVISEWFHTHALQDWESYRETMADDFVSHTHGGAHWPPQGREELIATNRDVAAGAESFDVRCEALTWIAPYVVCARGLRRARIDGVDHEWSYPVVFRRAGGRIAELHAFFDDPVDGATAALEFARTLAAADQPIAWENQAMRWHADLRTSAPLNRESFRDRLHPDFRREDRRSTVSDSIAGRERYLNAWEAMLPLVDRFDFEEIASRGELLHCFRQVFVRDGVDFAMLVVWEWAPDGLLREVVAFDPEDVDAAMAELDRRYYAGEGAEFAAGGAVVTDFVDANSNQDWDRYRACMADDFVVRVHTGLPWPELSVDEAVQTSREIADGTDEYRAQMSWIRWFSADVALFRMHRSAVTDGAESSWDVLAVVHVVDGRIRSLDMWRDLGDLDAALAEAEAVALGRIDPLPVENAATTGTLVSPDAGIVHDHWMRFGRVPPPGSDLAEALAARFTPDAVRRDHRTGVSAGTMSGAELLESIRLHFEQFPSVDAEIVAVRGERCALSRRTMRNDDGYEMAFLTASATTAQGQLCDMSLYDPDAVTEAVIELDRLYLEHETDLHENERAMASFEIAALEGDWEAHRRHLADDWFFTSHRGLLSGLDPTPDDFVTFWRKQSEWADPAIPFATVVRWVTPEIAVLRAHATTSPDGSAAAWDANIVTVWRDGSMVEHHMWDAEGLRDALAFAESLAAATDDPLPVENELTRFLRAKLPPTGGLFDFEETFAEIFHEDVVRVDHRRPLSAGDGDDLRDSMRVLNDMAAVVDREVLAVRGEHLQLARIVHADENGYELCFFRVAEAGDDGRIARTDVFDDLAEAQGFLDESFAATETRDLETVRAWLDVSRAFRSHDWAHLRTMLAPDFFIEGSTGVSAGRFDADVFVEWQRGLHAEADVTQVFPVLRFLGDGIVVCRFERAAAGLTVPGEWSQVLVLRWSDRGLESIHQFEVEQAVEAVAFAESLLTNDAVLAAFDTPAMRILLARDGRKQTMAEMAPGYERLDRRRTVSAPPAGPDQQGSALDELLALMPHITNEPVAARGERNAVVRSTFRSDEGFEIDLLIVAEFDAQMRLVGQVLYDVDDIDAATAEMDRRYESGEGAPDPLAVENDATRLAARYEVAYNAGDDLSVFFTDDCERIDRRSTVSGEAAIGPTVIVGAVEEMRSLAPTTHHSILAMRGERLALGSMRFESDDDFVVDALVISETDGADRFRSVEFFDPDALDDAMSSLEERYYAGEGSELAPRSDVLTRFFHAANQRDWDTYRRLMSDALICHMHGGILFPSLTADELTQINREVADGATHFTFTCEAVRWVSSTVCVTRIRRVRTDEVGRFEWEFLLVWRMEGGVCEEMHAWADPAVDDVVDAFAVAEELATTRPDPLPIENAATRLGRRYEATYNAGDDLAGLFAEDCERIDRRSTVAAESATGLAAVLESNEALRELAPTTSHTYLAVRGERLMLGSMRFESAEGFVVDALVVAESDGDDRILLTEWFDPDALDLAMRSLEDRYLAGEGAEHAEYGHIMGEAMVAARARDWETTRSLFTDDFVLEPHRGLGYPRLDANQFVAFLRESDDSDVYVIHFPVVKWLSPHVNVGRLMTRTEEPDGFVAERSHVVVTRIADGKMAEQHRWEGEYAAEALAFAEEMAARLADPLRLANAATRASDRVVQAYNDGRALGGFYSRDIVRLDRRRTVSGDDAIGFDAFMAALDSIQDVAPTIESRTIAVRGDRHALHRVAWTSSDDFTIEMLHVMEIDGDGRFCCLVLFDVDDLPRAMLELEQRYYAGEGAAHAVNGHTWIDAYEGVVEHDFEQFQRVYAEDAEVRWHGLLWDDQSGAEQAAHMEQSVSASEQWRWYYTTWQWVGPDVAIATGHGVAVEDGMEAEWEHVQVGEWRDGKVVRMDIWEIEQTAEALAYAEEVAQKSAAPS